MGTPSWVARLGVLVIHNDPVVETELWAMAPPGVTVHAARFESPTSGGAEYTGSSWAELVDAPDVDRGLRQLGQLGVSAICFCFGSASFFGGAGFDARFAAAAGERAAGTPVRTAGQAMTAALAAAGVRRPLVVLPPWFTRPTLDAAAAYLSGAGLDVAATTQFRLDTQWDGVTRHLLFDRGGRWEVHPDEVRRQVVAAVPAGADGVLIPGSGFRSREAIEPLERELGVPVVTSNQAVLWDLLRLAGVDAAVPHAGRLLGPTATPVS